MTRPETPAGDRASVATLAALGRARVALGCVFLLRTTPLLAPLHIPCFADAFPLLGWPDGHPHLAPFIPPLPDQVRALLCVARTIAAVAFTLGLWAGPAGLLAGALGYLTVLQDPAHFYVTFHVLFLGAIVLACTDAVGQCALRPRAPQSPTSSAWLVRAWVASIYAWAAIAKLRTDWLDGRTLQLFARGDMLRPFVVRHFLATESQRSFVAHAVVVVEFALAPLLLWRRTRRAGLALALVMHATLEFGTAPDLFGWAMVALLLAFWTPTSPAVLAGGARHRAINEQFCAAPDTSRNDT
jgi:hypothetical protein